MYNYSEFDDAFIKERNYQFRNQVKRRVNGDLTCLLYTSPSPRDVEESRMPSSA